MKEISKITHKVDFCVVGGGMAGVCAAISAARHGAKVVLMQDRPMLGGNASSEIRMWICGAHGKDRRETGILEEILLENFYRNTGLKYTVWDTVIYEKVKSEANITLLLNCTCLDAKCENEKIQSVKGWQMTTQTFHTVEASIFADCSGDSILAPLTGADFTFGRESKEVFGEQMAPDVSDEKTMGNSCIIEIRETNSPKQFIKPKWAYTYKNDSDLPEASHNLWSNFWWIEGGGNGDTIKDAEENRDELLKIAYGVWDHFKNQGDHGFENWELDWIGVLPGKRESRRYLGDIVVRQQDVQSGGHFDDVVAYGGWSIDNHDPNGFYHRDGQQDVHEPAESPWGIPYRSLYSRNIDNLMFAGRNISVSHVALSSSRVMATCAVCGQAVGTAAAIATSCNIMPKDIDVHKLQDKLRDDDCMIPFSTRKISDLSKNAEITHEKARTGIERGDDERVILKLNEKVTYTLTSPKKISEVRIVFDSNLNRPYDNMPCRVQLNEEKYKLPKTLVKDFNIIADGKVVFEYKNNRQRLVKIPLDIMASQISLQPIATHGEEFAAIFRLK